jgi:hypothetical protein
MVELGKESRTGEHDYLFVANAVESGRFKLDVHTNSVSRLQLGRCISNFFFFLRSHLPSRQKNILHAKFLRLGGSLEGRVIFRAGSKATRPSQAQPGPDMLDTLS